MDELLKRKQKQSLIDAANMGDDSSASPGLASSLANTFGGPQANLQQKEQQDVSDRSSADAAARNALQHKMFMLQQIAAEKARGPVEPQVQEAPVPDMNPDDLAGMASDIYSQQQAAAKAARFPNLKKPRGQ